MTDNKDILNNVSDNQLEEVSGGGTHSAFPKIITRNLSNYKSGDTPKYQAGQELKIACRVLNTTVKISCQVLSVSATANCGMFYKEFGYKVRILESVMGLFKDNIFDDVYESCLYEY